MTSTLEQVGLTTGTWTIDPAHSEVSFTVRHLMTKVRGSFTSFSGEINVGDSLADSSVHATIDVDSVDTRQPQRDQHLRSNDFFANGKTMEFTSTGLVEHDGDYLLAGNLTINGVTKPVELALEFLGTDTDAYGATKAGFEASTTLVRKDFGVDFNVPLDGGKLLIGDKVTVELAIQASHA